jgi:hypothetical protein
MQPNDTGMQKRGGDTARPSTRDLNAH